MSRLIPLLRRVVRVAAPALAVVGGAAVAHQASATPLAPAKLATPAPAAAPATTAASPYVSRAREIIAASGSPQVVTGDIRTDMVALIHRVQDDICAVRARQVATRTASAARAACVCTLLRRFVDGMCWHHPTTACLSACLRACRR